MLFGSNEQGQLSTSPMVNFTRATFTLGEHNSSETHIGPMVKMSSFRTFMRQEQSSVQQQMVTNHEQLACENRQKLKSITSVIYLWARQNIVLRGHRSEDWNPAAEEEPDSNPGNFLALLRFRVDAGDTSVARGFHLVPGVGSRTTYRSPSTQNELIDSCGNVVLDQLLKEIWQAPFHSILANEATDAINKEQMAIVVRFVDSAADIREDFLGFVQCTDGVTGRALANLILAKVEKWGLGLEKLRGQGYDGASNMAGHINGWAALIRNEQPAAMYFHCASHLLNLSVLSLTNIPHVRNMWDILTQERNLLDL